MIVGSWYLASAIIPLDSLQQAGDGEASSTTLGRYKLPSDIYLIYYSQTVENQPLTEGPKSVMVLDDL